MSDDTVFTSSSALASKQVFHFEQCWTHGPLDNLVI